MGRKTEGAYGVKQADGSCGVVGEDGDAVDLEHNGIARRWWVDSFKGDDGKYHLTLNEAVDGSGIVNIDLKAERGGWISSWRLDDEMLVGEDINAAIMRLWRARMLRRDPAFKLDEPDDYAAAEKAAWDAVDVALDDQPKKTRELIRAWGTALVNLRRTQEE